METGGVESASPGRNPALAGRLNGRPSLILGCIFAAASILCLIRYQMYHGRLLSGWDAQFYYAEARALTFGGTPDITAYLEQTPWTKPFDLDGNGTFEAAPRSEDGRIQSKYPLGVSVVESVLLAAGFSVRKVLAWGGLELTGPPGLSTLEIWIVALGLILVTSYGLTRIAGLAPPGANGSGGLFLSIGAAFFGTTLFFYTAMFPFMSHGLGFVGAVLWLLGLKSLWEGGNPNKLFPLLGALAGFLFLIRPQQVMLPLLSLPWLLLPLKGKPPGAWLPGVFGGLSLASVPVLVTLVYNKFQFGVYSLNGYAQSGEGFDFLHPDLWLVLFSSHRGLFFYSPIVLLAAPGVVMLLAGKRHPWLWPMAANAVLQIYLVASWWEPAQGESFGMRMWTESVALVALGLLALRAGRGRAGRLTLDLLAVGCCLWTLFLALRYQSWV